MYKNRIACEHPDIVSAAISVGGPLEVSTNDLPWYFRVDPLQNPWLFTTLFAQVLCNNSSAVPVMHWHGTLDPLFPWCLIIIFLHYVVHMMNMILLMVIRISTDMELVYYHIRYGGIYHSVPYTMGVWRDNNRCLLWRISYDTKDFDFLIMIYVHLREIVVCIV